MCHLLRRKCLSFRNTHVDPMVLVGVFFLGFCHQSLVFCVAVCRLLCVLLSNTLYVLLFRASHYSWSIFKPVLHIPSHTIMIIPGQSSVNNKTLKPKDLLTFPEYLCLVRSVFLIFLFSVRCVFVLFVSVLCFVLPLYFQAVVYLTFCTYMRMSECVILFAVVSTLLS